ncbi:MAG: SUMF1/EgtB/PvdO family nonheme iron enzyme [Myxococcota bacterium]
MNGHGASGKPVRVVTATLCGVGVGLLLLTPARSVDTNFIRFGQNTQMAFVAAGDCVLGADNRSPHEGPEHVVFVKGFYIDRYEVTNRQYKACVDAGVCKRAKSYPGFEGDDQPVVGITWADANTWCNWAGKRLPTEAEWEKAARGPNGRTYPWGEGLSCVDANYGNNTAVQGGTHECPDNPSRTVDVGSYPQDVSPYGVYDMAGNAWEYVADFYQADYYRLSPSRNPTGPATGSTHIIKGGSWFAPGRNVALSSRIGRGQASTPNQYDSFRCAGD